MRSMTFESLYLSGTVQSWAWESYSVSRPSSHNFSAMRDKFHLFLQLWIKVLSLNSRFPSPHYRNSTPLTRTHSDSSTWCLVSAAHVLMHHARPLELSMSLQGHPMNKKSPCCCMAAQALQEAIGQLRGKKVNSRM